MPDNGNAVVEAPLTDALTPKEEKPGTEVTDQTDLTEVVAGLSRTITSLKKQLATKAVEPDADATAKITAAEERATKAEKKAANAELLVKYGDVAPIISKLMSKDTFDASLIDDAFVAEIRAAKGTPQAVEDLGGVAPAHNPTRGGRLTPEQQDAENLKTLKDIFELS